MDVTTTRRTAKGTRTRRRIVAAAADLVFDHGLVSTTMEDVKAAAGVSSSQLYHYFEDKDALVRAVIAQQADALVEGQRLARLDTLAAFRAWRDEVVDLERRREFRGGCPLGSLGNELAEGDPRARAEVAASFERWEGVIRDGLRAMQTRGDLSPEADPDSLALATLAALQGGLLLTKVRRDPAPLEASLDAIIRLIECSALR